jgi:hypothetical protein
MGGATRVARRPGTVTAIAVLAIGAAVVAVIMGVALVMAVLMPRSADERDRINVTLLLAIAAWCFVGGLLQLAGGWAVFRGVGWGRVLLAGVLVLHVVLNVALAARSHDQLPTAVFVTVFTAFAVGLLWTPRATTWFAGRLRSS